MFRVFCWVNLETGSKYPKVTQNEYLQQLLKNQDDSLIYSLFTEINGTKEKFDLRRKKVQRHKHSHEKAANATDHKGSDHEDGRHSHREGRYREAPHHASHGGGESQNSRSTGKCKLLWI